VQEVKSSKKIRPDASRIHLLNRPQVVRELFRLSEKELDGTVSGKKTASTNLPGDKDQPQFSRAWGGGSHYVLGEKKRHAGKKIRAGGRLKKENISLLGREESAGDKSPKVSYPQEKENSIMKSKKKKHASDYIMLRQKKSDREKLASTSEFKSHWKRTVGQNGKSAQGELLDAPKSSQDFVP